MQTLAQLRAALGEKIAALKPLQEKAFGVEGSDQDLEAVQAVLKDIKRLEAQIETLEEAQAAEARSSKVATTPVAGIGHSSGATVPATAKTTKPGEVLAIIGASMVKGREDGEPALKVLADHGYAALADELIPHNRKAVNTLVSSEGGILVPQAQVGGGILPLLQQRATFLDAGPTRIELVNGQYKVARGASGATASYVGQGGLKPLSTPTFDAIDMSVKKLAGIVPMTEEAGRWTIGGLQAYIENDLRNALARVMDLNMWLGTGAGTSPTGVFNKAGIQTVATAPYFATDAEPTVNELERLTDFMFLAMISNGLMPDAGRWRWVMPYRTAMFLGSMRLDSGAGDLAFPTMANAATGGGTWRGFPVTVTAQVPTNLGVGTNETFIALVDMNHVLFGEEMAIRVRWSDQATLDPDGSGENLIHLLQMNMQAVLAESMHDVGLRYAKAVVKATGILF